MTRRNLLYDEWWSLPEWERTEYEAFEVWRSEQMDIIAQGLIDADKYTPETHAMLMIEKFA